MKIVKPDNLTGVVVLVLNGLEVMRCGKIQRGSYGTKFVCMTLRFLRRSSLKICQVHF